MFSSFNCNEKIRIGADMGVEFLNLQPEKPATPYFLLSICNENKSSFCIRVAQHLNKSYLLPIAAELDRFDVGFRRSAMGVGHAASGFVESIKISSSGSSIRRVNG
ncbi:hypothetical protein L1887_21831 [Cichorium endivia]|nr:hypothetical protein L1887_21831 [Cichorium endivia]